MIITISRRSKINYDVKRGIERRNSQAMDYIPNSNINETFSVRGGVHLNKKSSAYLAILKHFKIFYDF